MQSRQARHAEALQQGISEIIDMRMDHIELMRAPRHRLELHEQGDERILYGGIQAQRPRPHGFQLPFGEAVARCEQRDFVAEIDQSVGEIGDHPFRTAIKLRRHRLDQRR